jgi:YggT family protein
MRELPAFPVFRLPALPLAAKRALLPGKRMVCQVPVIALFAENRETLPLVSRRSLAFMRAILEVLLLVLQLYSYVIVIVAIMSWLIAFNVINVYNDFVRSVWNAMNALTEPLLRPIRQVLPNLGGLDISPVILLLLIYLLQKIIVYYIYPYVF